MGKRKAKKLRFLALYIIIPFLTFFLYTTLFAKISINSLVKAFVNISAQVNYSTFTVSFDESIPSEVQESIKGSVDDIEFQGIKRFEFVENGEYIISQTERGDNGIYSVEYVPVGHMYWIKDSLSLEELQKLEKVYIEEGTTQISKGFLKQILDPEISFEEVGDMAASLKESESTIGLVSPQNLDGAMKLLSFEDRYFLDNDGGSIYIGYGLKGEEDVDFVEGILRRNMLIKYEEQEIFTKDNIVKINMSGVVAISRGLAKVIDSNGDYNYPAREMGEFLANSDLTHISNEVSFVDGCSVYSGLRFCSKPEYIEALVSSGVDIVELTGNHNNDFGSDKNADSIEMYKEEGWDYFGGGLNSEDASKILYKEVKGNTIAFVGYNYFDTMLGSGALASSTRAGANSYSVEKLSSDIKEANEIADIVIVTFQFQECYSYPSSDVIYPICYKPLVVPDQKGTFRRAIDLGADLVVGTQAHQPQTYEAYKDGLIFYGLGNLYFDQSRWIGTRQGMVISLYVKDNKILQAQITPTLMGKDLITRLASDEDALQLLNLLKSARDF